METHDIQELDLVVVIIGKFMYPTFLQPKPSIAR